ncbi:type II secretion system protein [Planococcus sp. SIMBA_160]
MNKLKSQRGLTLVEVLAALVILGIVFVGIMTVFPQMTLFNNKTEAKLDTMNLARQEMAVITKPSKWEKILDPNATNPALTEAGWLTKDVINTNLTNLGYNFNAIESQETQPYTVGTYLRYQKEGEYRYVADIYLMCEPFKVQLTTPATSITEMDCIEDDRIKMHKVHMKVYVKNDRANQNYVLSSETYSYIRYIAKKQPLVLEDD